MKVENVFGREGGGTARENVFRVTRKQNGKDAMIHHG
jgi:hypothetical protein